MSDAGTWKRDLGFYPLLAMSLGTVIGSGWLLLPGIVAAQAGPASVLSWVLAGLVILCMAAVYAELGAAWPAPGAVAKYPNLSHGAFTGHMAGWAAFISYAIVPSAEAVAVVRYAGDVWPGLTDHALLTPVGMAAAAIILALIGLLNYVGVKYLGVFENWVTALKYIPILLFVGAVAFLAFRPGNFTHYGGFAPHGATGILLGTSTTVFAYLGFRQALDFGAEARNPGRDLPRAVLGTVIIATLTYALISVALVGAIDWVNLAGKGVVIGDWSTLASLPAPMYAVAGAAGLGLIATLILVDGIVSPNGPNASNVGTVPRVAYTMAEEGTMPKLFLRLHPVRGTPGAGLLVTFLLEVGFLLVTGAGYTSLIDAINVGFMVAYAMGPVSLGVLRRTAPQVERPFRLRFAGFLAPLAFVLASLLLYWERWPNTGRILGVLMVGVVIYLYYARRGRASLRSIRDGAWLLTYLVVMGLVSYVGASRFGGLGVLPFGPDIAVVALVSLGFYVWGVRQGVPYRATEPGVEDDELVVEDDDPLAGAEVLY